MYYKQKLQEAVCIKLGELYLTRREEHILQKDGGVYQWRKWFKLHDLRLIQHLEGEETIGIFCRQRSSKVLIFDVDTKEKAEVDTRHLVNVLEHEFNINRSNINIVFSGNKGYHVTLFFDKLLGLKLLKKFYLMVLAEAGFSTEEVEMRPLYKCGVKLPLGIHKKTGKRCWFVDNQTFKQIESYYHIFKINKLDAVEFAQQYSTLFEDIMFLNSQQKAELEAIQTGVSLSDDSKNFYSQNIKKIIENKLLLRANTRNEATLFLAIYFKDVYGYSLEESISVINSIMLNTKRNKPSFIDSSEAKIQSCTKSVVTCVYKNDYNLQSHRRDVYLTKEEILHLLSIKKWNAKLIYFIHLVQSKRYAKKDDTYYISYNQMRSMLEGAFSSQQAISNQIKYLVKEGYIEIVKKGGYEVDSETTTANTYKLMHHFEFSEENILIESNQKDYQLHLEEFLLTIEKHFNINIKSLLQTRSQKEKITKYQKERGL